MSLAPSRRFPIYKPNQFATRAKQKIGISITPVRYELCKISCMKLVEHLMDISGQLNVTMRAVMKCKAAAAETRFKA